MITLNVFFDVASTKLDSFLDLLTDMVKKSSLEDGNSYYRCIARSSEIQQVYTN